MKLALAALLLAAAPLSAQTQSTPRIVVNVVVTLVRTGSSNPVADPTSPPVSSPVLTPAPISTPVASTPPVTSTPAAPGSSACVNKFPDAVQSMAAVAGNLVQAEQIFATALAQRSISASTYASGLKTLSLVSVDNADVRDLIRIDGPVATIAQNLSFVSAEVGTLPGMLGSTAQLRSSLSSLTGSMQASLASASASVAQSTCPQTVP